MHFTLGDFVKTFLDLPSVGEMGLLVATCGELHLALVCSGDQFDIYLFPDKPILE